MMMERDCEIAQALVRCNKEAGQTKHTHKELVKVRVATQYIGEGAPFSSAERYRQVYAQFNLANTGRYTSDDVVFVASNGRRRNRVAPVHHGELQGAYKNIAAAMKVGARFVMDTPADAGNRYNVGEQELINYLQQNSPEYFRVGNTGVWAPL